MDDSTIESKIAKSRSLAPIEKNTSQKIELAGSLLKPEIKEALKHFAKLINGNLADDVTDTTTHLVVDSGKYNIKINNYLK
jgi:hypothetical protein